MDDRIEKLSGLQNHTLLDIVKNYKKYDYTPEIRDKAIKILEQRGIKQQSLKLTGGLNNDTYDEALAEYKKYSTNSLVGLVLYILSAILFPTSGITGLAVYLVALLFIGFSFSNMKKINDLLKDGHDEFPVLLAILSLLVYFIVYFINRNYVRERINLRS